MLEILIIIIGVVLLILGGAFLLIIFDPLGLNPDTHFPTLDEFSDTYKDLDK